MRGISNFESDFFNGDSKFQTVPAREVNGRVLDSDEWFLTWPGKTHSHFGHRRGFWDTPWEVPSTGFESRIETKDNRHELWLTSPELKEIKPKVDVKGGELCVYGSRMGASTCGSMTTRSSDQFFYSMKMPLGAQSMDISATLKGDTLHIIIPTK